MISFIRRSANQIRESLWFVPTLFVMASIALALGMISIDAVVGDDFIVDIPLLVGAGADGAREMLGAVATSMATIAGVTFSITIVAVTQASNQYSPRILGNFAKDRANQVVLGAFVGIFTYSLVVLRSVRAEDEVKFVPSLSVLMAFVLAIVGMGFLIFFIHHIAGMLRVGNLLASVSEETLTAVDRLFPSRLGEAGDEEAIEEVNDLLARSKWLPVPSRTTGYIQSIDNAELLATASSQNVLIRMDRAIGEFVVEDSPLASIAGSSAVSDGMIDQLNQLYVVMPARTVHQDAAFGIREIVDVALKALSPSINETTTAINCVDHLGAILSRLADRRIEERIRKSDGEPRVIARGPTFVDLLDSAFDEIRRNAADNANVLDRMFTAIETVEGFAESPVRRSALIRHVRLIVEAGRRGIEEEQELTRIEARARALEARLLRGKPEGGAAR